MQEKGKDRGLSQKIGGLIFVNKIVNAALTLETIWGEYDPLLVIVELNRQIPSLLHTNVC